MAEEKKTTAKKAAPKAAAPAVKAEAAPKAEPANIPEATAPVKKEEVIKYCKELKLDADVYFDNITKEFIDNCHKNNIKVNVWTVDSKEDAESIKAKLEEVGAKVTLK